MNTAPGSPAQRAAFFHSLAQLVRSGLPLPQALKITGESLPACAGAAQAISESLGRGLDSAFREAGFPEVVCAALGAADFSGKSAEVFSGLAAHYHRLAEARKKVAARLLYPAAVAHAAPVLLMIPRAVLAGDWRVWVVGVAASLGLIYGTAIVLWVLAVGIERAFRTSAPASAFLRRLPLVGGWLRTRSAARFADVFAMVVGAGGSPLKALTLAGAASGDRLAEDVSRVIAATIKAGANFAASIPPNPPLDPEIVRALRVGEASGRLAEESRLAAGTLDARALAQLETLAEWTPRLVYFAILLWAGWMIVSTALTVGSAYGEILQ